MNPPSKAVNYGNLPPNQAGQQQALGPAQGGQRPSQTGQPGAQGQTAPNQKPNPQPNQQPNQQTGPGTKPAANNQGKSNLGDLSKSRNHLIERDLNDDFVRGGGANVISDRLNFSQRRVVQGPPQIQYVDNIIERVVPAPAAGGRRGIAPGQSGAVSGDVDDSINITARNILAEAEAKVALLIMEGNRLKWLEAQRREELRRLRGGQTSPQPIPAPPTSTVRPNPPLPNINGYPIPPPPITPAQPNAPAATRVVQQTPTPQTVNRTYVQQQPTVVSTSPVVQRVSQTTPVATLQPQRVIRAEPTTTYVQQPTTTYVQQPTTTYVQQPSTTYTPGSPAVRSSSQTYVTSQPTTAYVSQGVPRSTSQTYVTSQPTTTVVSQGIPRSTSQTYVSNQPTTTVVRGPSNTTTQVIPAGSIYTTQRPSQTTRVVQQGPYVTTVPATTTQTVYPTTTYNQGQPTTTYVR